MSNAVEVLLFSRAGTNPLQIEPAIEYVAWRLNRTGQAKLHLEYSDPECTQDNLALGNRVLIRFENGLRPFGGVIDVPRSRTATGVTFNVYTGDRILSWRRTQISREFSSTAPGTIFQTLIEDAAATWYTGINIGSIYTGGTVRDETYRSSPVLDSIWKLQRRSGEEFEIVPVYVGGMLSFLANWSQSLGTDVSDEVLLVEDQNILPPKLNEQGPIASNVLVIGGAEGTTNWEDRVTGAANSTSSRDEYGYREIAEIHTDLTTQASVDASATAELSELQEPRKHYTLQALDRDPAGFDAYAVGDTVALQAFLKSAKWAIDDTVRILGREWTPDNTCRLEVK